MPIMEITILNLLISWVLWDLRFISRMELHFSTLTQISQDTSQKNAVKVIFGKALHILRSMIEQLSAFLRVNFPEVVSSVADLKLFPHTLLLPSILVQLLCIYSYKKLVWKKLSWFYFCVFRPFIPAPRNRLKLILKIT